MSNRSLHITIIEGAAVPQRRAAQLRGRTSTDPQSDYVIAPVEDPESDYVIAPVEDPESDYVIAPVEDPESDYVIAPVEDPAGGYASGVVGTVHAWNGPPATPCCCCATAEAKKPAAQRPGLAASAYSGFVIVRLAPGIVSLTALNLWSLAEELGLSGLKAVLELPIKKVEPATLGSGALQAVSGPLAGVLVSRPLIELKGKSRQRTLSDIWALEARTATSPFRPLHSLVAYWRVDLRPYPDLVDEVVGQLNALAEVDLAYRELAATDPQLTHQAGGLAFAEDQGYLDDAPVGIGASWAWKQLAGTAQLTVCDLEQGWVLTHQDLKNDKGVPLVSAVLFSGANRADEGGSGHHGTAVLGQLAAAGKNVKGAVVDLGRFALASHYKSKDEQEGSSPHPFAATSGHVAAAIVNTLDPLNKPTNAPPGLQPGDVLLLEVQRGLLPTEVDAADLDAIRLAVGLGITVVEAAGNGGFDLDRYLDPDTGQSLKRGDPRYRDSGAILVGAARSSLPHDRAPFSNYGSRLDCFGWGETVTTCGYGDLAGTAATNFYTNKFSGTSSAAPIIAGAAALLTALHQEHAGSRLEPRTLRALLADPATGTRQGRNVPGHIGVMPDLNAIVRSRLQLVADVYLRRHVNDDGSPPLAGDEIGSSPDVLLWAGDPNKASANLGEGPRANIPAPGTAINSTDLATSRLYVRLRNRGGSVSKGVRLRLFASPAATLITPERWAPIGAVSLGDIAKGDTLTVWETMDKWQTSLPASVLGAKQPLSFLAVQHPQDASPDALVFDHGYGLPPGPPYFDWAKFRAFLRSRGVAWRNVHPVTVPKLLSALKPLEFFIAGTPDQARYFDFEVIQRLPAGVKIQLQVPDALSAKLRQRQPWLESSTGPLLPLPTRPRITFGRVLLAPGFHAAASFEVKANSATLLRGHSLAIRQLWRGEEVGRVTWWFGGATE